MQRLARKPGKIVLGKGFLAVRTGKRMLVAFDPPRSELLWVPFALMHPASGLTEKSSVGDYGIAVVLGMCLGAWAVVPAKA